MSQLFKTIIPLNDLISLLNVICQDNSCYVLDYNAYKRGMYSGNIQHFLSLCALYYYDSKRKYVEKKTTYNSFVTVIRQLCNLHSLSYTKKMVYDKTKYEIVYTIDKPLT